MHYKQLLAVGPEKLHTVGTEKEHGVTETYKALPRKDIAAPSVFRNLPSMNGGICAAGQLGQRYHHTGQAMV